MATAPDLMNLLALDPSLSKSPFGGNHRFVLIEKDFTNSSDFVFSSLLQHFGRREPNSQVLLVSISHNWSNYSIGAAKCGFNLRKRQNMGNIEVLSIMDKFIAIMEAGNQMNICDFILEQITAFINCNSGTDQDSPRQAKPSIVMIDDLSILRTIGCDPKDILGLLIETDKLMRDSSNADSNCSSYLIAQTMITNVKSNQEQIPDDNQLNFLVGNLENICDLHITLKPLETGHSTRVDGTITFTDNRLPSQSRNIAGDSKTNMLSNLLSSGSAEIGSRKAYFYKLGDRRVRLTTSAFIY